MPHVTKIGGTEKFAPVFPGEQVRFYREQFAPLVAMRIVSVVVDPNPRRPAGLQHAKNLADAGGGIGPVIRRLDGNRVREEIRLPGNSLHFAGDKHQVFKMYAVAASVANHFVGNVHAHYAALRNQFSQPPRKPARTASNIENVVRRAELHFLEDRQGDGQVLLLHALPAARFRPAVEFLAQGFGIRWTRFRGWYSGHSNPLDKRFARRGRRPLAKRQLDHSSLES